MSKFLNRWNEFFDLTVHTDLAQIGEALQLKIRFTARDLAGHKYAGEQSLDLADALLQLRAQKNAPPKAARALAAETAEAAQPPFLELLARQLDGVLNRGLTGTDRTNGFVLLLFPFAGGACDVVSNGEPATVRTIIAEQLRVIDADMLEPTKTVN